MRRMQLKIQFQSILVLIINLAVKRIKALSTQSDFINIHRLILFDQLTATYKNTKAR